MKSGVKILPKPEVRIVPVDSFWGCAEEMGTEILGALVEKVKEISQYDWLEPPLEKFYSAYRGGYSCQFHSNYVFTFERKVEKASSGSGKVIVLLLKTIQRA